MTFSNSVSTYATSLRFPRQLEDTRFPSHDGGQAVYLDFHLYQNGRLAMQLTSTYIDEETNATFEEPWATCTVNLPGAPIGAGEVYIKDYSENEGIPELLSNQNILGALAGVSHSGWVVVPRYKLSQEVLDFLFAKGWKV